MAAPLLPFPLRSCFSGTWIARSSLEPGQNAGKPQKASVWVSGNIEGLKF